jgi:LysM repeat protein
MFATRFLTGLFLVLSGTSLALPPSSGAAQITRSEYIDFWKDEAIYQMVLHKIPASITLAQGILESGDGNSELARKANNHFGIKCHSDWQGKKVYHDDDRKGECFRHYSDAHESFEDHSSFLQKTRYAPLFELKTTDYEGWAKGLKKCGYATSPQYASLLIRIVEENNLTQFDDEGIRLIKKGALPEPRIADKGQDSKKKKRNKKAGQTRSTDLPDISVSASRTVDLTKNRIKSTIVKEGEDVSSVANDLDMMPWQIYKYNDFPKGYKLTPGEVIYIQPKRSKGSADQHVLGEGDTLWKVSQRYGIKMKSLYKKNGLEKGSQPSTGTKLRLR